MKRFLMIAIIILIAFTGCTRSQARAVSTWSGGLDREWEVNRAGNQIYSYNYFYDQLGAIKGAAASLYALDPILDRVEINGIKMNIVKWVAEYNENARKTEGMARYKPQDLPYQLNTEDFIGR